MSVKTIIKNLLKRALSETVPEADTSTGTAINDLLIEPSSIFLEDVFNLIGTVSSQLRIDDNADLDTTLDSFASNWFLERKPGTLTFGTVRLFLSEPSDVNIPARSLFLVRDGLVFTNPNDFSLPYSEVVKNRYNELFFVDIEVEATRQSSLTVEGGDLIPVMVSPITVEYAEAVDSFTPGTDAETNQQFQERIKKTIVLRNLVSAEAIETYMKELFPWITKVRVVGYGDPEMLRDTIDLEYLAGQLGVVFDELGIPQRTSFHVGNKIDIHVNYRSVEFGTVVLTSEETDFHLSEEAGEDHNYEMDLSQIVDSDGNKKFHFPIYDIVGVQVLDEDYNPISFLDDVVEELVNCSNPNGFANGMFSWSSMTPVLRYSPKESIGLRLKSDWTYNEVTEEWEQISGKSQLQGMNLAIVYRYFSGYEEIQKFLEAQDTRLICADALVKSFIPCSVTVLPEEGEEEGFLEVKLATGATTAQIEIFIREYLKTLEEKLIISELISSLHENGFVTFVKQPVKLKLMIPPVDRYVGFDGDPSNLEETSYFYDSDAHEATKKYLSYFDLEELGEKGVEFVSDIKVLEIT